MEVIFPKLELLAFPFGFAKCGVLLRLNDSARNSSKCWNWFRDGDQHFYLQEGGFAAELAFFVASLRPNSGYFGKMLRGIGLTP